jgi:hypothetical protein
VRFALPAARQSGLGLYFLEVLHHAPVETRVHRRSLTNGHPLSIQGLPRFTSFSCRSPKSTPDQSGVEPGDLCAWVKNGVLHVLHCHVGREREAELSRNRDIMAAEIAPANGHTIILSCSHTTIISTHHPPNHPADMIMPQHRTSVSSLGSMDSFTSNSSSSIPFTASEGESVTPVEGLLHVEARLDAR